MYKICRVSKEKKTILLSGFISFISFSVFSAALLNESYFIVI